MFTSIKTSQENKLIVSELSKKLNFGSENVIARIAFSYSLASNIKFELTDILDSKGKEYSKNVLFGNHSTFYIAMICMHYKLYKTDKDIPRYIKLHLDHGLKMINIELKNNPNLSSFDFLMDKIENGLLSF